MSNRPFLVTLVGALNLVLGLLVVIGAIVCFFLGTQNLNNMGLDAQALADINKMLHDLNMSWSTACNVAGVALLIPGLIDVVVGYGLLKGWRIMWWIGVILNALGVIAALILIVSAAMSKGWGEVAYNVILLIINGVILWYMLRPNVKEFFNI